MPWESQCGILPELIHDPPNPMTVMPQPSMKPTLRYFHPEGFHRIVVYILECSREVLKAGHDPREKAASPNMSRVPVYPVERHREHTEDPLHDPGQGLPFPGPNHEVDMVPHHAEIFDPKPVPSSSPSKDTQKEVLQTFSVQNHLSSVRPGRHMVYRPCLQLPWLSHAHNTLLVCEFACVSPRFRMSSVPGRVSCIELCPRGNRLR